MRLENSLILYFIITEYLKFFTIIKIFYKIKTLKYQF